MSLQEHESSVPDIAPGDESTGESGVAQGVLGYVVGLALAVLLPAI